MDKITLLIIVGILTLGSLYFVTHILKKYSLNNIKNRTVGDGQFGVARWISEEEKSKSYKRVLFDTKKWRRNVDNDLPMGIVVGYEKKHGKTYALVDDSDVHTLMIGAAGVGKTACFLYPNLEYACASGMSFITSDTKGDLYRNYGKIAEEIYGYSVSVIDLRNPTRSSGNNMLHLVNKYMDLWLEDKGNLAYRAKAEKYAKIISKTIISSGASDVSYGQNAFFYDSAEGLLTASILIVSEFAKDKNERHIISVYKFIQELFNKKARGKSKGFEDIINKLPENHKAKWFAGAAVNASEVAIGSIISTALSRLNVFLDSEMEQILCQDTAIDAEKLCSSKSAIFIVMPEEDNSKYFMVSLIVQQLYREILSYADECGGKLKNRLMMYLDEFGTIPRIESAEMMFSASRSRKVSIVAIVQSFAQLNKNYGQDGAEIIIDNTQLTIFGGFAPNSKSAIQLSSALGTRTTMTGSISLGKEVQGENLQMTSRELMSQDELKVLPKGTFVVMKTGTYPMIVKLKLFYEWGISFIGEYKTKRNEIIKVKYVSKDEIENSIEMSQNI